MYLNWLHELKELRGQAAKGGPEGGQVSSQVMRRVFAVLLSLHCIHCMGASYSLTGH